MAECKVCQKALNREASEIGSWCIDCIKEMSDESTGFMEYLRKGFNKEKLLILIFAAIGAVGGIIVGITYPAYEMVEKIAIIIAFIWTLGGLGTGLGFFISEFGVQFKWFRDEGRDFGEALKLVLLRGVFFLVLGFFAGVIFFLFLILRRKKWIKKLDTVIASEEAAITELEDYTLGKDINKLNLSRKISIIADNFKSYKEPGSIKKFVKELKIVQLQ